MLALFHPFTTWVSHHGWACVFTRLLVALAVPGLVRMLVPRTPARPKKLRNQTSPRGIVDLELAGSRSWADRIMDAWGPPLWRTAIVGLHVDFFFIVLYTNVLAIAVVCSALSWKPTTLGWLSTAGVVIAWLQWVAGGFDVVEDVLLLRMLHQRERQERDKSPWVPRVATMSAVLKFVFIWVGVLYALSFPIVKLLET
jgi:hypothetical protein